jgi:hypothetical protein
MMLALAVLFAAALTSLGRRYPVRRRSIVICAGILILFELWPGVRPLYSAAIPRIYRHVAAAPEGTALLEIPFGIRDGTSNVGNFTARSEFFQTAHGKTLMGGYLSRVSRRRIFELRQTPVLNALALLSEGRSLPLGLEQTLLEQGSTFLQQKNVEFVVIDRARASTSLHDLAIRAFRLEQVDSEGPFELYRPRH